MDWLNATFAAPSMSVAGLVAFLGRLLGRPLTAIAAGGRFGFEQRVDLVAHVASRKVPFGCIAWGGEAQAGRWMLQVPGSGCGLVTDWEGMRELLEGLDARITRLDLAVDFLDGEHTVDEAVTLYGMGGFNNGGRSPKSQLAGDWLGGVDGRTFYVGKASNGKLLRVYEKGRQLGDPASEWVRFEVQLGNRDRVIPLDALTERDVYFAGCYPVLESFLEVASKRIETEVKGGLVTVSHLMAHLKRSYGKLLGLVADAEGVTTPELVQEVRLVGVPRRLSPSALVGGLSWAQLLAQLKGKR